MKRLLELTDGLYNGGAKEYVDVDSITNVIPFTRRNFFGGIELVGSKVFSGGMNSGTYVRETPEQILTMIKNKQFALEY